MPKVWGHRQEPRSLRRPVVTVPVAQASFLEPQGLSREKRRRGRLACEWGWGVGRQWRGTLQEKFPPRFGLLLPKSPGPSPPALPSVATTSLV